MDIERDRYNDLLKFILTGMSQEEDPTKDSEPKEIRQSGSWPAQRVRLVQRAFKEHEERLQKIKETKDEEKVS